MAESPHALLSAFEGQCCEGAHACQLLLSHRLYLRSSVGSTYQPQSVDEAGHWHLPGHLGMY